MNALTELIERLHTRKPLPALVPDRVWDHQLSEQISSLSEETADPIRSGLLLWNDDLNASHDISQQLGSAEGSYWHGIMHRREGDFSNAKYWFQTAGTHPIHSDLYEEGKQIWPELASWGAWKPAQFVDEVQAAYESGKEDTAKGQSLRELQVLEMRKLLEYCLERK